MTIERRQFLTTSEVDGQGLDREITIDKPNQTLRVHTSDNPSGIRLANKIELDNVVASVTTLSENLTNSVANLQSQIDSLDGTKGYLLNVNGFTNFVANTESFSSEYPYKAVLPMALGYQLTAEQVASLTASVFFEPSDVVAFRYASFCKIEGVLDSQTSLYDVFVTVYSKLNAGSLTCQVALQLNKLL